MTNKIHFQHLLYQLNKIFFFLFIVFLPLQLGKHFFPSFVYISGVQIDYFIPTLYISDIAAVGLIIMNFKSILSGLKNIKVYIIVFLVSINIVIAISPPIALYKSIKFIEMFFVFLVFKNDWQNKHSMLTPKIILGGLLSTAFVELVLTTLQVYFKHSIQGIFYFLGERFFTINTPDIAKASFDGVQILRGYGSFSHPNSLAGFYLIVYFLVLTFKQFEKHSFLKYAVLSISALLIFLSFSKIPIIIFLVLNFWFILRNPQAIPCTFCRISRLVAIAVLSFIFISTKGDQFTLIKRFDLVGNAFTIITQHFFFGTGVGNYLMAQSNFPIKYSYFFLQPVHNIFLLFLSETGVFITLFICYILFTYFKPFFRNQTFQYIFIVVLLTGMFDHYWLTLQQNFLILPFLFALL